MAKKVFDDYQRKQIRKVFEFMRTVKKDRGGKPFKLKESMAMTDFFVAIRSRKWANVQTAIDRLYEKVDY